MSDETNSNPIPEDDRKLFAGGLPQEATEDDLKEYFATFGEVTSVNLKMDQMTGRSRGFAFVVFESTDTLDAVLGQEHAIKGKKVAVKKAASKQGKIYVGKFTGNVTEDEIKSHFSQFGNVVEIQRPVDRSKNNEPKNFCFITFDKEEPADTLLKKGTLSFNGQEVEIKKVTVKNDGGMGGRGGRGGGMRGGRGGGGGWGGGYDSWGGYDAGWGGYGPPGPWAYGGYGAYGGWGGEGGYGGGAERWARWGVEAMGAGAAGGPAGAAEGAGGAGRRRTKE